MFPAAHVPNLATTEVNRKRPELKKIPRICWTSGKDTYLWCWSSKQFPVAEPLLPGAMLTPSILHNWAKYNVNGTKHEMNGNICDIPAQRNSSQ